MQKLNRSRSQRIIAGVCGGLAEYFGVDVTLVRLAWILIFFAGGTGGVLYLIAWVIIPEAPAEASQPPVTSAADQAAPPAEAGAGTAALPPAKPREGGEETPDGRGRGIGLFLIGLGAYFLLQNFLPRFAIGRLWPLGLVALGLFVILGGRGER